MPWYAPSASGPTAADASRSSSFAGGRRCGLARDRQPDAALACQTIRRGPQSLCPFGMVVRPTTWWLLLSRVSAVIASSAMPACSPAGPIPADSQVESSTAFDADPADGPDTMDAGCPHDLPDACPSPEPSWVNDVEPIVDQTCNACHGVGGVEQPVFDFSTYEGVHKDFGAVLNSVYSCLMPPPDAGGLMRAEREALLAWLVCRAPNN
jgi:hypothetical protein